MLERVKIQNFQCHELLDITFDPALTTIVGDSDVGKSAIIRALRWVATNRPRGDAFVKQGERKALVKVRIDGKNVERIRNGQENTYKIGKQELKAFGTDVPEQVSKLFNLGEANISGQHDPPFWFTLTPGELAKRLNQIVDLGVIDEVTGRIAQRLRKTRSRVELVAERLSEATEERERLGYVPALAGSLNGLVKKQAFLVEKVRVSDDLSGRVRMGVGYDQTSKRDRKASDAGEKVILLGNYASETADKAYSIVRLLEQVEGTTEAAGREVPELGDLDDRLANIEVKRKRHLGLTRLIEEVLQTEKRVGVVRQELEEEEKTFKQEVGETCPLCGSQMP